MSEWKKYQLQEIASVQTGPFGSQLHQSDYVEVGTPIITVEHLGENRITHNNLPRVTDEDKQRLNKYWLQEGDIVFSRVGSVDRRAYVKKEEDGWLFSGRCLRVRPKKNIDGKYLSYFFGLEDFKKKIRSVAVGATMPSLNTSIMNDIEVILPNENIQKEIASILSSLDDKIELNLQMNQTLEAMAQAIFKEWFVNFNFPGFDGELVDGLPKGWRMGNFEDLTDIKTGKGLKREEFSPIGNFSVIGANGELGRTDKFLFEDKFLLTGRVGTLGSIKISYGKKWYSDNVLLMRPKNHFYYTYQILKKIDMQSLNRGSTQPLITQTDLRNHIAIIPEKEVVDFYERTVFELYEKIFFNEGQIQTLTQIRDNLLPKLMTGKIEIKA